MTEARFGQKLVTTADVGRDDRIFRTTDTGVELMMLIDDLGWEVADGRQTVSYTGRTFRLNPSVVGQQMSGIEIGTQTWTIPLGGSLCKVVPIEDAD